jgi:hypothetical protein
MAADPHKISPRGGDRGAQKALAAHIEPHGPDAKTTSARCSKCFDSQELLRALAETGD